MTVSDSERIEILHRWAERLLADPPPTAVERRQSQRVPANGRIALIPVDPTTHKPLEEAKTVAVIKDQSETGLGLVTDTPLSGEVFVGELEESTKIHLLQRIRKRRVPGGIFEYGMRILDTLASLDDLAKKEG